MIYRLAGFKRAICGALSITVVAASLTAAVTTPAASAPPEAPVSAASTPTYSVTVAARQCPDYPDIMANRARNNIMQSLQNVGNNSLYSSGSQVNPTTETAVGSGQANCTPLVGWDFKLGTGIGGADTGTYGTLSKVSGAFSTPVQTQSSVPLLNSAGVATGGTISGATTVQLTAQQLQLATKKQLWIQGGVPGDPLNSQTNKAFGALRCAIDNYNGDNVEWIGFPANTVHVFCYAYYVDTTPASATIIIRKTGDAYIPPGQQFGFTGSVSYNPGGTFSLAKGAQATFVRQSGVPWTATENALPTGYTLNSLSCNAPEGVVAGSTVTITPNPGQTIICTFDNGGPVPTVSLALNKITLGATGTADFNITDGGSIDLDQSATTTAEATPETASGDDSSAIPTDTYSITETGPANSSAGTWAMTYTYCVDANGLDVSTTSTGARAFDVTLAEDTSCYLTNTFTPSGQITIKAKQTGSGSFPSSSGTSGYVVEDPNGVTLTQTATNTGFDTFATATGDPTSSLPLQTYTITGIPPQPTTAGTWEIDSVTCNAGSPVIDQSNLFVTLTLSGGEPAVECEFVYRFRSTTPTKQTQTPNKCVKPVRKPRVQGTTIVIGCRARTNVGRVKWRVRCSPYYGNGQRGDVGYCRGRLLPNGAYAITTYGRRPLVVQLTGTVAGNSEYRRWIRSYVWYFRGY